MDQYSPIGPILFEAWIGESAVVYSVSCLFLFIFYFF